MAFLTWLKYITVTIATVAFVSVFIFINIFIDGKNRFLIPYPNFDASMIPDQSNRVIIITGGNSGVGRASAEQLCLKNAKLIIITSTSQASADIAAKEIESQYCAKGSKIVGKELKLEDHKSIKSFADWFREMDEPIHVLMLNAGLASIKTGKTSLGLDLTVGINWFGHFYLQQLLQDIVEKSAPSRIVILSSGAHTRAPKLDKPLENYIMAENISGNSYGLYSIAKLFNILHARELNKRLRSKGVNNVQVLAVHPGHVKTNFLPRMVGKRDDYSYTEDDIKQVFTKEGYQSPPSMMKFFQLLCTTIGLSPLEGALSQLYAATSPEIVENGYSGGYIVPIARYIPEGGSLFGLYSEQATDDSLAKQLWEIGEKLLP